MKVTDKDYYLDNLLYEKVELMIHRLKKIRDMLLFVDGYEGYGKTTISVEICYLVAEMTKRKFDVDNIFFDIDEMIDFASKSKNQIILWDEAILGGLASEWRNKSQIKLRKLLGVARKKSHFFVFNIPRFYQLAQPIIDRAIGLIHVYSPDEITMGHFCYYNKQNLTTLYNAFKIQRRVHYNKFFTFRGKFTDAMYKKNLIDIDKYEAKKDLAIAGISEESEKELNKIDERSILLKYRFANFGGIDDKTKAKLACTSTRTITRWKDLDEKYPFLLRKHHFDRGRKTIFIEREQNQDELNPIPTPLSN